MRYDGTPVASSSRVRLDLEPTGSTSPYFAANKSPSGGIAEFKINMDNTIKRLKLTVRLENNFKLTVGIDIPVLKVQYLQISFSFFGGLGVGWVFFHLRIFTFL